MAGDFKTEVPSLKTLRGRIAAIQQEFRRALVDIDDAAERSKEARQWIKLAHEVTERRDLEKEVQKLLAQMERDREQAERGEVGASQGHGQSEDTDLQ